jgi:hypothetical protein
MVENPSGMSSEAVQNGTGRTWEEWTALLDADNAGSLSHADIAKLIAEKHGLDGWWGQGVAVGYEQIKGLRVKGQTSDGFAANASKTLQVPLERLWAVWGDEALRAEWLDPALVTVTTATENKSFRARWNADDTRISVDFYAKGEGKSSVALQHSRLPDLEVTEARKAFWKEAMARMQKVAEGGA